MERSVGGKTVRAGRRPALLGLLALWAAGCAAAAGPTPAPSRAGPSRARDDVPGAPAFVRATGRCWVGGRITLDPGLRPASAADELANIGCDNIVVTQKTEDGSTKLVHADGEFAEGFGECHYQFTSVPAGHATYSGKVVALSIPDYRYTLTSAVEFNALSCGESLASLNQRMDFVLAVPDVRGRGR